MGVVAAAAPWVVTVLDPEYEVAKLRTRFPEIPSWYGDFTGEYWTLAQDQDGQHRLISAADPGDLSRQLDTMTRETTWPASRPTQPRPQQQGRPTPRHTHRHQTAPNRGRHEKQRRRAPLRSSLRRLRLLPNPRNLALMSAVAVSAGRHSR